MLYNNFAYIRKFCNDTVGTTSSVHSLQSLIITRVAKEFDFKTILIVGGTDLEDSLKRYRLLKIAYNLGCEIKLFKLGYPATLLEKLKEISIKKRIFIVKFGINLEYNRKAIVDSVSHQVLNIPDYLDYLIVPVGSGITMGGIIRGIIKYKKKVKRFIGIQTSGYDRTKTIDNIIQCKYPYEFYIDKKYPYAKKIKVKFNKNEYLDPIYESKAFLYFRKNFKYRNKRTLFWIVGNSSMLFKKEKLNKNV